MLIKAFFSVFFFIIFCPMTIKFKSTYFSTEQSNDKKIYFSIALFGFIGLISGYITFEKKFIAVHISDKKAILIYPSDVIDTSAKYKKLKNFEVFEIKNIIEVGNNTDDNELKAVVFLKNFILHLGIFFKNKKSFSNIKNYFIINDQTEGVNIFFTTKVVFNFFAILMAIFKKILEKIYAKKQTN